LTRLNRSSQQLRQFRNIRRNPLRLVLREQLGGRSPAWLIFEINVSELLAVAVAQACVRFVPKADIREAVGI